MILAAIIWHLVLMPTASVSGTFAPQNLRKPFDTAIIFRSLEECNGAVDQSKPEGIKFLRDRLADHGLPGDFGATHACVRDEQ